ncbi:MAG: thiopeptide-type bacteriocin biosynthesis protein [Pseudonocardiaceae bacterium]
MERNPDLRQVEEGVLAVLAGEPCVDVAARMSVQPTELAAAAEQYRAAGYAALEERAQRQGWHQVNLRFADWRSAEHLAVTQLGPALADAAGLLGCWFFIRKAECWRLRYQAPNATSGQEAQTFLTQLLDRMLIQGQLTQWWETRYEPEVFAFGGPAGMTVAHNLFHHDSQHILAYLSRESANPPPNQRIGRREVSILLCSLLMRAAGQEWCEQGDVWTQVAQHRPTDPDTPPEQSHAITPALRRLMTVDTGPTSTLIHSGPLQFAADWMAAFHQAGHELGNLGREGHLTRGLRAILAHHVLFAWNRLGLPYPQQSTLASTARDIILRE